MSVNVVSYSSQGGNGSVNNSRGGYNTGEGNYGVRGGQSKGRSFGGKRIYCQLRKKLGHFVDKCYHRVDKIFRGTLVSLLIEVVQLVLMPT